MFEAAGPDPFKTKPRTYIGVGKTKAILDMEAEGLTPTDIAAQLGIPTATAKRMLAVPGIISLFRFGTG